MKRETIPMAFGFLAGAYFFLGMLVAMQLSCGGTTYTSSPVRADFIEAAVEVRSWCGVVEKGRGSGVTLGGDRVLTAWHVVHCPKGGIRLTVSASGLTYAAVVEREWTKLDVARIRVYGFQGRGHTFAKVQTLDPVCAASVIPFKRVVCGAIAETHAAVCPDGLWCHTAIYTAEAIPGNSGSGVYDSRGALVGIVTGRQISTPPYGLFSQIWDMREEILSE